MFVLRFTHIHVLHVLCSGVQSRACCGAFYLGGLDLLSVGMRLRWTDVSVLQSFFNYLFLYFYKEHFFCFAWKQRRGQICIILFEGGCILMEIKAERRQACVHVV